MSESQVIGTEELIAKLEKAGVNVARAVERRALRRAAKIVQMEAKRLVPKDSGALRRSIKVRSGRRSRVSQSNRVVSMLPYAKALEVGRRDRNKTDAQPYLFPALERKSDEVMREFREAIRDEIAML